MRSGVVVSLLFQASASLLVEDEVVQLQVRGAAHVSEDDDECNSPTVGHTVEVPLPDFSGVEPVKRKCVDKYPQQFYAAVPMAENGIQIIHQPAWGMSNPDPNGEQHCGACGGDPHSTFPCFCAPFAIFPLDHHYTNIIGSRTTEHSKSTETGELRWLADEAGDPQFQAVPGTVVGFAERFHVLDHEGEWGPEATDAASKGKPDNYVEPPESLVEMRTKLAMAFNAKSKFGGLLMSASFDKFMQDDLKAAVAADPVIPPHSDKFKRVVGHVLKSKKKVSKVASGTKPSSISTSCIHLLEHPYVSVRGPEGGRFAIFPLNVYLGTVRGQTVFSPTYQMSFSLGRGFFSVVGPDLIFHHGASSLGEFTIGREGFGTSPKPASSYLSPPTLYISSPTGDGEPSDLVKTSDVRFANPLLKEFATNWATNPMAIGEIRYIFNMYAKIPMSYTWLYKPLAETCDNDKYERLQQTEESTSFAHLMLGQVSPEDYADHMWDTLSCGSGFLRGSEDDSNGLDIYEVGVWAHFLMEWPSKHRLHSVRGSENGENGWHWKHMR